MHNGIEGVLSHSSTTTWSELGSMLRDKFSGGCVLILENAVGTNGGYCFVKESEMRMNSMAYMCF